MDYVLTVADTYLFDSMYGSVCEMILVSQLTGIDWYDIYKPLYVYVGVCSIFFFFFFLFVYKKPFIKKYVVISRSQSNDK